MAGSLQIVRETGLDLERERVTDHRPSPDRIAVRVEGLGKDFRHPWSGRLKTAVDGLTFDVPAGKVFGLLGPNGAGKTTTLKMLLGLLVPSRGRAWLLDRPAGTPESRRGVGFLPENPYFYEHLTGIEFLEFSGRLAGLDRRAARAEASELVERVGLGEAARVRLRRYSKGMLQRVGLAHALLGDPELLFLDEPMSGLDPLGRRDVADLIRELRRRGTTIVFSSHILHDVEVLCDQVAILRAGRLVALGGLRDLLGGESGGSEILVRAARALLLPPELAAVAHEESGAFVRLTASSSEQASALVAWLAGRGHAIVSVTPQRRSLEDLFVDAVEDSAARSGGRARGLATAGERSAGDRQ